jgi:hypothetical protein
MTYPPGLPGCRLMDYSDARCFIGRAPYVKLILVI